MENAEWFKSLNMVKKTSESACRNDTVILGSCNLIVERDDDE
jgi:hypothetical protein